MIEKYSKTVLLYFMTSKIIPLVETQPSSNKIPSQKMRWRCNLGYQAYQCTPEIHNERDNKFNGNECIISG